MQAPSWLDLRLVFGVMLVLASIVGGAMVFSAADHRESRWAVTRDLAAGTVLNRSDLRVVRVQLGSSDDAYLPVTEAVVGRAVQAGLRSGQLLPRSVLGTPEQGVRVTVPLRPDNGPTVDRGQRITVWLSTKTCHAQVLLSGAPVQQVMRSEDAGFGADTGSVLVLKVPAADARRLVAALDLDGAVIRVGVLSGGQQPDPVTVDLAGCAGTAR
ncbi:MAG TPA: SAF domain-containing protein [Jatrophihabitans sp.]|nr:SAF domain-containing protein [Jatrophihabitans sp.]